MSEVMIPMKAGGGTSSDELTAKREHVLAGYTAVTKDSDDEAVAGTMPDNSTCTSNGTVPGINSSYPNVPTREADNLQYCEDVDGVNRINMCPPRGYYPGGGGSYIDRPAADFGNASASDVSANKTFTSSDGLNKNGSLAERGQYQNGGVAFCDTYFAINGLPEGIYRSNGASWAPEARCTAEQLRNALGIRGDIIKSGNSIAGIAGTLSVQSAINFSAAAISYDRIRISWKNPSKGPWQGVFIQMSSSGVPGTGGGSRVYTGTGWANQNTAGAENYVDITSLNPGTTYYFTCTSYVDNLGWGNSYNVQATTSTMTFAEILNNVGDIPPTVFYTKSVVHGGCTFNSSSNILAQGSNSSSSVSGSIVPDKYTVSILLITLNENAGNTVLNLTQHWVGKQIYYRTGTTDYTGFTIESITLYRASTNKYQYIKIRTTTTPSVWITAIRFPS